MQAREDAQSPRDGRSSRRGFLRSTGAAASALTTTAGVVALAGVAAAYSPRDSVAYTFDDDRALLEKYQPELVTADTDSPAHTAAFCARSGDHDTTALLYWQVYGYQDGFSQADSHIGDHEPIYVFVENEGSSDEGIAEVDYSAWHWYRGRELDPVLTGDPATHTKAYVFDPHHHHSTAVGKVSTYNGEYPTLKDLRDEYPLWLDNGLRGTIADGAVYDPWVMEGPAGRSSWWDGSGFSGVEATFRGVQIAVGLGGVSNSDLS